MHGILYQLTEASWLMLLGMGLVYLILGLMVLATQLMSRLIQYVMPPSVPSATDAVLSDTEMAVIAAAVHIYRQSAVSATVDSKEGRQ